MAEKPAIAEAAETKPVEAAAGAPAETQKKEETIGEVLKTSEPASKQEETVPLAALLEVKKANKQLAKDMAALQKSIEDGASKSEVADDLETLATEHKVPVKFLKDFARAVRAEAKKEMKQEIETEVNEKLKPVTEKERAKSLNERFNTFYDKAMEAMPEYKDIVNKDVIKTLCLAPENASKTLTQIIEESFGRFVPGKRSIDAGTPTSSKNDNIEIDAKRAAKDPEYFKEIMANPALKKKYNDDLSKRLAKQL